MSVKEIGAELSPVTLSFYCDDVEVEKFSATDYVKSKKKFLQRLWRLKEKYERDCPVIHIEDVKADSGVYLYGYVLFQNAYDTPDGFGDFTSMEFTDCKGCCFTFIPDEEDD